MHFMFQVVRLHVWVRNVAKVIISVLEDDLETTIDEVRVITYFAALGHLYLSIYLCVKHLHMFSSLNIV